MSNTERKTFATGIFRLVSGNPTEKQTKDARGALLTIKTGPNAGQPTQRYSFGIAIPKVPGKHWAESGIDWLADIWATGNRLAGTLATRKDFSWKVQDGDSTELNQNNRKNSDNEGWPGHWVVFFSSSYAPQTVDANAVDIDGSAIKRGHFVRVSGSVDFNGDQQKPGVYINHSIVMHAGIGPEIKSGPDARVVFAAPATAPAGMTAAPVSAAGAAFAAPAAPPPPAAPAAPLPAPTQVAPAASFIAPPAASTAPPPPAAVVAPPPPAAPAGPVWKGPAGTSYDAYKAAGWTDDQMRAGNLLG